jgi:alanine racemase
VSQRHTVRAGEGVSYGALWRATHDTEIAVIGMGYADGYPRNATLKASVLIGGERRPVLGRICMDQMMVDVTGLDVGPGDWAELWGRGEITVSNVAAWGDTIEYEVLTGLGTRVERQLD